MDMIKDFLVKRTNALHEQGDNSTTIDKIILTSEEKKVVEGRLLYPKSETFPYEFIINNEDIGQGTGDPKHFKGAADEIMLSSLISIRMQLRSESLLLNHCSNFHKLIMDFAVHNCGVQKYMETLVENDNPDYHLKCQWGRRSY